MTPDAASVRNLLAYDPQLGVFTWRVGRPGRNAGVGSVAGTIHPNGYRLVRMGCRKYSAHRLAWLYMTGEWPAGHLDHINGVRDDNRIANLRPATDSQNVANSRRRSDNKSGFKGVDWNKQTKKWRAQIGVSGHKHYLGLFDDPATAHAAYVAAAIQFFGPFARAK